MAAKKNTKDYKIKVTRDGPYLVSGGAPLADQAIVMDEQDQCRGWREGQHYPAQENYALCRCGGSGHKPYCDGTHLSNSFNGAETAGHEPYIKQAETIQGPGLKLTDAKGFCSWARFCDRGEGAWDLTRHSGKPENKRMAIEEACNCPSGRLVAWDEKNKPIEPDLPPSLGLVQDPKSNGFGPIWVRGGIPVESAHGQTYEVRNRMTLCRCGHSANKPFCDGSHQPKEKPHKKSSKKIGREYS